MCEVKRYCITCFKDLDVCLFGKRGINCIVCQNIDGRIITMESESTEHEPYHDKRLQRTYGITLRVYWGMYYSQNGRCDICKVHFRRDSDGKRLPLVVDHDHVTGQVRGLLCTQCNTALGMLKELQKNLERAQEYLWKHGKKNGRAPTAQTPKRKKKRRVGQSNRVRAMVESQDDRLSEFDNALDAAIDRDKR